MRGDTPIIAMHQAMLEQAGQTDLLAAYQLLSQQIVHRHQA